MVQGQPDIHWQGSTDASIRRQASRNEARKKYFHHENWVASYPTPLFPPPGVLLSCCPPALLCSCPATFISSQKINHWHGDLCRRHGTVLSACLEGILHKGVAA